ncbi:uncharacterized protein LOC134748879 [Cydia strobilella]|uniref:uncharacterized protein LOC134748879 n=1 Tax=Cydia strobilella TaxID=1100964 RepID=UPI0030079146
MAANMMMKVLRTIQLDLAEQKDYIKNLHVVYTNINEKFNLMEGKLNQHQATMEKLEEEVRKNNTLLFGNGNNVSGIERDDTTMTCEELDTNDVSVRTGKNIENDEARQLQILNKEPLLEQTNWQGEDNNKNNGFQRSDSGSNVKDSITGDMREIKELFADFVQSGKRFFEETVPPVRQKEDPISQTYFIPEQISQLNGEFKQMMSEAPTYEEQIKNLDSQLNEIREKYQSQMNEMRELVKIIETEGKMPTKKTATSVPQQKPETIQIPSYSRLREIRELNAELKKITEKYQETNIPNIEVVHDTSLHTHPVMKALEQHKGVALINFIDSKIIYIDYHLFQPSLIEQLKDKPDMTLEECLKDNWGSIKDANGLPLHTRCHFYTRINFAIVT